MFNIAQFRQLIVQSSLKDLNLYSQGAEELLVFTCAAESRGGTYLQQIKGPALGIYQMEPLTYNDIWQNFIKYKPKLSLILSENFDVHNMPSESRLIYDLRFATAMSRIHYLRFNTVLPSHQDVDALWAYYKKFYNTELGKAKKEECIKAYQEFTVL